MNIYHITYAPTTKTVRPYFWGCNLSCRGCLRLKGIYNYHLKETGDNIFN